MKSRTLTALLTIILGCTCPAMAQTYAIVDTGQLARYDNDGYVITPPAPGTALHGQDAQYVRNAMNYQDNGDGAVTDLVTGLIWQKTPDFDTLRHWAEAKTYADSLVLAGHDDWRLPTIKELYSLIHFDGAMGMTVATSTPYIDTDAFDFEYPTDPSLRSMDCQYLSSTGYVGTVMGGQAAVFGVNFADGRIMGYPADDAATWADGDFDADRILADPAPQIAVSEMADSSVNLVVRPWTQTTNY